MEKTKFMYFITNHLCVYTCLVVICQLDIVYGQCQKREKSRSQKFKEFLEKESSKTDTGFEFLLRNNIVLNLERHEIFGIDKYAKIRRGKIPTFQLVQQFIKTIKGIPDIKPKVVTSNRIEDHSEKSNTCLSQEKITKFVPIEIRIYHILKRLNMQMKQENKQPFPLLESYLDDIERSTLQVLINSQKAAYTSLKDAKPDPYTYIASHPLLIYRMIRRLSEDLGPLLTHLESNAELITLLYKYANMSDLTFPTSIDLSCALQTLTQAQRDKKLKAYEVVKGTEKDFNADINLNVLHSLELGAFNFKNGEYDFAIDWFRAALRKSKENPLILDYYPEFDRFCKEMHDLTIAEHAEDRKRKIMMESKAEIGSCKSKDDNAGDTPGDTKGESVPVLSKKDPEINKRPDYMRKIPMKCDSKPQIAHNMEPTMGMIDNPNKNIYRSCKA